MKRPITAIIISAFAAVLCSCAGTEGNEISAEPAYINTRTDIGIENAVSFDVSKDIIYVSFLDSPYICSYTAGGEKISEYYAGEGLNTPVCCDDNYVYVFSADSRSAGIRTVKIPDGETSFCPLEISTPLSMAAVSGKIYLVYRSEYIDPYYESVKFSENDNYIYQGEKAVCVDINAAEVIDLPINNVLSLKKSVDGKLVFYAYDDIGGYYFTFYDTVKKSFSEKIYNNSVRDAFSFDYIPEKNSLIYSDFSNRKLVSVSLKESNVHTDFMYDVSAIGGNDLRYSGGSVYVLDAASGNIFNTCYSEAVKDNAEIKILSSEIYSETPYGCGYRIDTKMLSDSEFALSILAGDTDYDICMMSSMQPFSLNIRDKGAFYPLNGLPSAENYLESCFPYINTAARNTDGDIWMLPIAVDVPCIIYSPENCKKNGIEFNDGISWEYLLEAAERLYENSSLRGSYSLNQYQVQWDILNRYNYNYAFSDKDGGYDTPMFRRLCELLKANNRSPEFLRTRTDPFYMYPDLTAYYSNYLFELMMYKFSLSDSVPFDTLKAAPTPSLGKNEKSCADCVYFCVNANSDNLSAALDYIDTYCSYMMTRNDSYMLADKSVYPYSGSQLSDDLYDIYSDAAVIFELPKEIFWDDVNGYISGKTDIDSMIAEIERKTDIYINE